MLSRDSKEQTYVDQLLAIVQLLQQSLSSQQQMSVIQIFEKFHSINSLLGNISVTNVNDINLLITKQIQCRRTIDKQLMQEQASTLEMYDTVERFCLTLVRKTLIQKILQKQSLMQVFEFMGMLKTNYIFKRQLIWNQNDRSEILRRRILNQLEWVNYKPINHQNNNNIYYKCLNQMLQLLSQSQDNFNSYLYIIEQVNFLHKFASSINSTKLIQIIRKQLSKILAIVQGEQANREIQVAKYKCFDSLKNYLSSIVKQLENDTSIYSYEVRDFKREIQTFFNQVGLIFMTSQSVASRLSGLRLLGIEKVDQNIYLEWIIKHNIIDIILKQTEKQAFVNNSSFIFELLIKNLNNYKQYLIKILQFIRVSKPPLRKSMLRYLQKFQFPDQPYFHEQIITFLLSQANLELLTEQAFDVIVKYVNKISSGFNEYMLCKLVSIYLIVPGIHDSKSAVQRCQTAIIDSLTKIIQKRVFGQLELQEKLTALYKIYNILMNQQSFSKQKVTLFCSVSDKIMSIYSFKQESKQKLADWLCSQARILDKSLRWITNLKRTNSTKSITKIQNIISDILFRISSQIKKKLVEDIEVLVLSVSSIKIFKSLLSFGQNVQKLQQLFENFIQKIYDASSAPQTNAIKCIKHFLFSINGPNISFQESGSNYFETKLVASEIYGLQSLNTCLMNASNSQVRDQLAELLSDIYTNYCLEIKQQGNMHLISLFEEIISNFQSQYCLSIKQNNYSKILGVLALIKHLMMATQIFGVGDLKPHNSLVITHYVSIKIVSDIRINNQQPFQKSLPANMTLMEVMNQVCHHFNCDLLQVQLRKNDEPIPRRYNGLTLQQLNLDRKNLKIVALQINISQKNKQSLTIQNRLSQKAQKVITQMYNTFAVNGKMGRDQVMRFIKGVTLNDSYPGEEKIQNFIKQYDDDQDGNITLQNFLNFYYIMSFKKDGKSVWTNITNMGYRYDLKKISEDWGPVDQKFMFRYYLHNSLPIYDTLFSISKSQNEEMSQRGIEILFRLPSRSENLTIIKNSLDKSCLNSYQIQYYLIGLQNGLQKGISQQMESIRQKFVTEGKASEIFAIMTTVFQSKGKNRNQKNCLSMCIKILRSICGVPDISRPFFNQDKIQISNKLKLPYTEIFVQLAKQALKAQDIYQFQSCFALQLTLDFPKREQTDGINEAVLGAFNNSLPIRQIACNFIYLASRKGQDIQLIFNQQVDQNLCDVWFQTLSKIVDYGSVNLEKILQKCHTHIENTKQTIKHIYDPVLSGNLFIYLCIARKKKQIISFKKLVNIAENILSTQNRNLIYQIMAEVDPINSITYVKELIENSTIDPDKQISLKFQYVGLRNLGSTCYINSVLQMLFWIKKFRKYLLFLSSVASNEQHIETSQTIKQTKKMFTYLQNGFNKFYDMTSFCNVYKTREMLSIDVNRQEDAHQFYIYFLEVIQQYFLKLQKDDVFEGLMISKNIIQYVCKECQHRRSKQQAFRYVHLQVKGYDTLQQSLKKLVEPQQIHDYNCQGCKKKVEVTKHTTFSQLPQHLILYLNRIDHDIVTGREIKISSRLSFPQSINLQKFMAKQRQSMQATEYRLKAVIIHSGTCSSGHYYLIVRINKKWFKFDDKIVTEYSLEQMQSEGYGGLEQTNSNMMDQQTGSKNAYMLCYQKKGLSQQINHQKYSKDPEMMELIKDQKKYIINQLKVCNDTVFKFNSMMWNKVQNAQMKIKSVQQFVSETQRVNIYEHLFDLSGVLLKFLSKFWKLSNPSYIHQLGSEISTLFDYFPQKSYEFLSQLSSSQVLHLLCLHSESDINNVFKHVLAKSIHLFYTFYRIDFNDEEPVASHVREIIEKLFRFLEDQTFYKNIYHAQPYLEFWKICLQCINPIEEYLRKSNFIMVLIKMLSIDYKQIESNFEDIKFSETNQFNKIQVLPTNISPVVANLLEIVVISKFNTIRNMHSEDYESQLNIKLIFSKEEIASLMNTQLYSNILKNDYDGQKCLGSVIARFCYKNELFSKQMAQIFLKGLKKYDQNKSIMMTMLQYISHYVAINDNLKIKRMKWVFGIPQLYMNSYLNFGFEENTKSNMYNYIKFDKYKPILQLPVIWAKPYYQKQTTPALLWFLLNIMAKNQTLLQLISEFPSPVCNFDSYISWLSVYFKKLQAIEQRDFHITKSEFIQQLKGIYQILVDRIKQLGKIFPLNKYIIGKNCNIKAKYEKSCENYKLVLYQHETYVLENIPYQEQNFSISSNFDSSPQGKKFILNSDATSENPEQKTNKNCNEDSVQKTAYTLEVTTESSLKLTFKMVNFQEQLYLQSGKFFINFPYSEMDFQQVNISNMIIVEELNLNQIKWSNRKFSYVGQKKSSVFVPVIKISEPMVIADNIEKISCGACTYLNNLQNDQCQICQTPFG